MSEVKQYYALCIKGAEGNPGIAFIHLYDDEEFGTMLALSLYTSPDGKAQRAHLERYAEKVVDPMPPYEKREGDLIIVPVSRADLIDAIKPAMPNTVLVNGKKFAASKFKAMLEDLREAPSQEQHPQIVGPPMPEHKAQDLEKAVGKTIAAVEFGVESSLPEWKHEGEAMVLHFTDGTALAVLVGSNAKNLSGVYDLDPGDVHTDLMPIWVDRPLPS